MQDNIQQQLVKEFVTRFGNKDSLDLFFAPGRVNLIGEHTDYNGGNVFPCALNIGTYALVAPRMDNIVRGYSINFPEQGILEFNLNELVNNPQHNWLNYPKGVVQVLQEYGYPLLHGLDIVFYGTIPNGAGLSSSASIEVLMAIIIKHYGNYSHLDGVTTARYCQQAENQFIGVNCGIMDQFAIAMGKTAHAILLDCNTLNYQYAPLELGENILVIANTNKKRGLADSKYNERRAECDHALSQLQSKLAIKSLCELDLAALEANQQLVTNPIEYRRIYHAISENQRTLKAVAALQQNDLVTFGQLMNQSHISLRDDYAVTGKELDSLVANAWQHPACIGSRMTGAGFGGCTVSLVRQELVADFIHGVRAGYLNDTGLEADFYIVNVGNGAAFLGAIR